MLLVDVGDMFQGTPIGNKTKGKAVIDYFNTIGYAFAVPGNHDFDLGRDESPSAWPATSHFPWLCANLVETHDRQDRRLVPPTMMLDMQGVKHRRRRHHHARAPSTWLPREHQGARIPRPWPDGRAKYRDELKARAPT